MKKLLLCTSIILPLVLSSCGKKYISETSLISETNTSIITEVETAFEEAESTIVEDTTTIETTVIETTTVENTLDVITTDDTSLSLLTTVNIYTDNIHATSFTYELDTSVLKQSIEVPSEIYDKYLTYTYYYVSPDTTFTDNMRYSVNYEYNNITYSEYYNLNKLDKEYKTTEFDTSELEGIVNIYFYTITNTENKSVWYDNEEEIVLPWV